MAKIKFGMMMTDARGKLGGQVFSKNRSGAYVRTKVTPVNPRTISQQDNRSALGMFSAMWSSLTEAQRNAWNGAVEQWQKTNVFGDLQKPTGKNLFTGLNKVRNILYPALAVMNVPPSKTEFQPFTINTAIYDVSSNTLSIAYREGSTGGAQFRVRATPPVSQGTTYVKNLLRDIGSAFTVFVVEGTEIGPAYIAKFGQLQLGDKVYLEITPCAENGQLGVPFMVLVTVQA